MYATNDIVMYANMWFEFLWWIVSMSKPRDI